MRESFEEHRSQSPEGVRAAVLTISDTRSLSKDTGGTLIVDLLSAAGHLVVDRRIVRDEPDLIVRQLSEWMLRPDIDVVITTGGTGIAERDRTYEAVFPLLERRLDGFGELFRMLSFQEIGSAAMLSRALAGVADRTVMFCLPGSRNAIRLAMEQLILPEVAHVVFEAQK